LATLLTNNGCTDLCEIIIMKKEKGTNQSEQEVEEVKVEDQKVTEPQEEPKDELTLLNEKCDSLNDKNLRLQAEFENYKKRTTKERIELFKTAGKEVIISILPVVDDFERAVNSLQDTEEHKHLIEGIVLVQSKLNNILKSHGLKAMDAKGKPFDPEIHEAVTEVPVESKKQKGTVVDDIEKGYYLNDTLLRFAKVVVGK
jgi:molecular chaperone GrpE